MVLDCDYYGILLGKEESWKKRTESVLYEIDNSNGENAKAIYRFDYLAEEKLEELPKDYILPEMTEEDCARRQAKETDYMVELLLNTLQEKGLIENTVIVVFTDHYLYTLSDQTILDKYKQPLNVELFISVTVSGMLIFINLVQFSKADLPIDLTENGINIFCMFLQP